MMNHNYNIVIESGEEMIEMKKSTLEETIYHGLYVSMNS